MNYEALKVWIDALQFLWMIGATVWVFWGSRHKELRRAAEHNARELARLDVRVARLEEGDKHALTHDDLGPVYQKLEAINGGLQGVSGEMKSLRTQVDMITKHLLQDDR